MSLCLRLTTADTEPQRRRIKIIKRENPKYRERVYALVRRIPPGRVMTYGQIAELLAVHLEIPPEQHTLFLKVARRE